MKKFIASLELRLSDLLLFVGFLAFIPFLVFGQLFMQFPNPDDVALKLWAIIPLFIVVLGCWGGYLYLEYKRGNAPKTYITWIFVFLAIIGMLGVAIQPELFSENVFVRMVNDTNKEMYGDTIQIGDLINVHFVISPTHRIFFIFDILLILMFIYEGLFIFPKRFTGISFIKYLGYTLIVFCFSLMVFSYITEGSNYIPYIKSLIGQGDGVTPIQELAMKSYIIHRNAYGMCLMLGIIFCYVNHTIERKWWYFLIAIILYINMIFTYCKTGIMITTLISAIYVLYYLVVSYQDYPNRNRIILICIGAAAGIAILLVGVSYFSKGKVLSPIYKIIEMVLGTNTLDTRTYIWDNSFQLLASNPLYIFVGRGFGLYNEMLLPMNTVNGDAVFPAHSAYVGLLSEGGIFYLLGYLCLLGYSVNIAIKAYKKSPQLTVSLSLAALTFIIYCFIEAIQYLVYPLLFPLYILYYSTKDQDEVKD